MFKLTLKRNPDVVYSGAVAEHALVLIEKRVKVNRGSLACATLAGGIEGQCLRV
jgi:hypothetical protein